MTTFGRFWHQIGHQSRLIGGTELSPLPKLHVFKIGCKVNEPKNFSKMQAFVQASRFLINIEPEKLQTRSITIFCSP